MADFKRVAENPNITQNDIGKIVFKDNASIPRIIQLLVNQDYLTREILTLDRRSVNLALTKSGEEITFEVNEISLQNRAEALKGVDEQTISLMREVHQKVIENCNNEG